MVLCKGRSPFHEAGVFTNTLLFPLDGTTINLHQVDPGFVIPQEISSASRFLITPKAPSDWSEPFALGASEQAVKGIELDDTA